MPIYENHTSDGVYVSDDLGEHHFATEEEYKEYRNKRWDALPIICDTCIYHLQEDKKKFKCPLDSDRSDENWENSVNVKVIARLVHTIGRTPKLQRTGTNGTRIDSWVAIGITEKSLSVNYVSDSYRSWDAIER